MRSRKAVHGFIWRFAVAYALLITPWPGFNDAYGRYFRSLGQIVFAKENDRRIANFERVPQELHHSLDSRIALANRGQIDRNGDGPVRYLELDTRGVGWIPTALLVALIVATPVPWWRRGWALVPGLLAIHGFILFSVAVYIWNSSTELSLVTLSPLVKRIAGGLEETLITQMGASFVAPGLIWILVTLRWRDLRDWQTGLRTSPMFTGSPLKDPTAEE